MVTEEVGEVVRLLLNGQNRVCTVCSMLFDNIDLFTEDINAISCGS